ncbi:MAG TPA: signal peptidase I [Bacteroidia bacterium]
MHLTNFSTFLAVYIPLYIATRIGQFLLFKKAGVKLPWLAFIPVLCNWPWIQLTGRPKSWMFWSIIPAANIIIWFSLVIDMMESFGKFKFWEQVIGVVAPFYMYLKMGTDKNVKYLGQARDLDFRKQFIAPKTTQREWSDAIFFALIVAYIIRTFQLEPYKIPTSSMEDSMLVGDFLFVSKLNYGPRFPITPIAFPLVHQDLFGAKAYSEIIKLPYMRLPGFQNIKRNDPVVFNVPIDLLDPTPRPDDKMQNYVKRCVAIPGDKLEIKDGVLYINDEIAYKAPGLLHNYYFRFKSAELAPSHEALTKEYDVYDARELLPNSPNLLSIALNEEDLKSILNDYPVSAYTKPVAPKKGSFFCPDCPENFIEYNVVMQIKDSMKLSDSDMDKLGVIYSTPIKADLTQLLVMMDDAKIDMAKKLVPKIDSIKRKTQMHSPSSEAFPNEIEIYPWNKDNYGPVILPKRDLTIKIDSKNFYFYKQAITVYENNPSFELRGSTPYLDGKPILEYTFKYDYYWMMGDNRDNSLDSRFWGYVPETHIVGKPLFVFFSIQYKRSATYVKGSDNNDFVKIRWNRIFKSIN